jgi:hypothetical protein
MDRMDDTRAVLDVVVKERSESPYQGWNPGHSEHGHLLAELLWCFIRLAVVGIQ